MRNILELWECINSIDIGMRHYTKHYYVSLNFFDGQLLQWITKSFRQSDTHLMLGLSVRTLGR